MSLFFRNSAPVEARGLGDTALQLVPSRMAAAGIPVDPVSASSVVAFSAGANLLSSLVSSLPIDLYSNRGGARKQLPVTPFLTDPSGAGYGMGDWLGAMMDEASYRGNAVGHIVERDGLGYARTVVWVPMDAVTVRRNITTGLTAWAIQGSEVDRRDIVHLRRFPRPGFVLGRSPIEQHANTLGIHLAASNYASGYYADGAHPSGILSTDQPINQADAKAIKDRFLDAVRGNREPVVLGAGVKYERVQDNPAEAQLLEQLKYSAADAARIIGVGIPELLGLATGDSDTYKNREQVSLDLLTYTLDPWLVKIETMISAMLPNPHVVRFNRNALLRTDLVQRYAAYRTSLGPTEPFATVNEVRALEDLPPVSWGDEKPVTGAQSDLSASGAAADPTKDTNV